jgi:predicted nucleotidyltransferase
MRMAASGLFTQTAAQQRMRHLSSGMPLDLLPYGEIEGPGSQIEWPPHGDVRSRVIGYREARAAADLICLPNRVDIRVVTLPGFLILKLFAFEDRALTEPRKDAEDIHLVLRAYTEAGNQDRLFTQYRHLLEVADFDYAAAGAHIAGADVRSILLSVTPPSTILDQLGALLASELDEQGSARLLGQVAPQFIGEFRILLLAFNTALLGR